MPIHFIPNDPLAQDVLPARVQDPRPDPAPALARFAYAASVPAGVYPIGSPEFLFWQCREAALAALEAWAAIASPLRRWQSGKRRLPLRHSAGAGLNAHYDRRSLSFLEWTTAAKTTWSGASTDAVAHEVGHALLDALRPDLWGSVYTEGAAFHEAFADSIALLVSVFDAPCRDALLRGGSQLRGPNFLEAVSEDVADGIRREDGPQHPQSLPRRALNALRWEIPINLPPSGPPSVLAAEPHSFSRVFTGCFYDSLCNIFAEQPSQDEQGLLAAARIAGELLVTATANAPEVARFFQAVGRAMILADEATSGGQYHRAIRDAFTAHEVALGSAGMLAPTSGLVGPAPALTRAGARASLSSETRRHLLRRIGAAPGGRLRVAAARLGSGLVAAATHHRSISLTGLDRRLRDVVAPVVESVLVGPVDPRRSRAARAVVLGHLPDPGSTADEVRHFVSTLLERGALQLDRAVAARLAHIGRPHLPTHAIRTRAGKQVLARVRFACGRS